MDAFVPTNPPVVTIIIPTWRRPAMLRRAVLSALNQSYGLLKVCIYDNASQDETPIVVAELKNRDNRVEYYCHPENIGAVNNFQFGILRVDTPFFSLLSDDDFLLPNFLESTLKGFEQYPEAGFSACSVATITHHGKILSEPISLWNREGLFLPPEGLLETVGPKHPIWTGILFRSYVVQLTGGLDVEIGTPDNDFISLITATEPYVISKVLVAACVIHDESSSSIAAISTCWPSWMKIIEKIECKSSLPSSTIIKFRELMTIQIVAMIFWIGLRAIESREFAKSIEAAEILKNCLGENTKALQLTLFTQFAKLNIVTWTFMKLVFNIRRSIAFKKNKNRHDLQRLHEDALSCYLDLENFFVKS